MWRQIRRRRRIYPPPRDDTYNVPEEEAAEFIGMSALTSIVLQNAAAFWSCSGFEYWSVAVVSAEGRGPIVSSWPPGGRLRCTDDRR